MKFTLKYLLSDLKHRPLTTVGSVYMIGVTSFVLMSLWGFVYSDKQEDELITAIFFAAIYLLAAFMLASSLGSMLSDLYRRRSDEYILLLSYGMTERGLFGMNLLRDTLAMLAGIPISGTLSAIFLKVYEYFYNRAGESLRWVSLLSEYTDNKPNHIEISLSFELLLPMLAGIYLVVLASNFFAWRSGIKQIRARYKYTVYDDRRVIDRRAADIENLETYAAVGRRRMKKSAFFTGCAIFFGLLLPLFFGCAVSQIGDVGCFPDVLIETESTWEWDLMTSDEAARLVSIDGIVSYDLFDDTVRGEVYRSDRVEDGHLYHCVRFILPDEGWEETALELAKFAESYGWTCKINKISEVDMNLHNRFISLFMLILSLATYIAVSLGNFFTVVGYLDGRSEEFSVLKLIGVDSEKIGKIKCDSVRRILLWSGELSAVCAFIVYVILSVFGGDKLKYNMLWWYLSLAMFTLVQALIGSRIVTRIHKEGKWSN